MSQTALTWLLFSNKKKIRTSFSAPPLFYFQDENGRGGDGNQRSRSRYEHSFQTQPAIPTWLGYFFSISNARKAQAWSWFMTHLVRRRTELEILLRVDGWQWFTFPWKRLRKNQLKWNSTSMGQLYLIFYLWYYYHKDCRLFWKLHGTNTCHASLMKIYKIIVALRVFFSFFPNFVWSQACIQISDRAWVKII